jgi:hypothetical protein
MKTRGWITFFLILVIMGLAACQSKTAGVQLRPPLVPEIKRLPLDYVLMVDNSGSIKGEERVLAREAIRLFVGLAETGDKVAVVAFDEQARLLANQVIQKPEDRSRVQTDTEKGLTFAGKFTDISQAFLHVSDRRGELFRGQGYSPVVILITDGKLEPKKPRSVTAAYTDILGSLKDKLTGVPFYTIGLGDKEIHDKFLADVNGMALLRDQLAVPTGGRFFHARSVNQLIEIYLKILRITTGASEIEGKFVYRVDESTERISAIVIKKTTTQAICATADMVVDAPGGHRVSYADHQSQTGIKDNATTIRWDNSCAYYDLIVIERPAVGIWRIGLADGRNPEVISLVKTRINLRYKADKSYWLDEQKIVLSWLYDDRRNAVVTAPYNVSAKFDREEQFDKSNHFVNFQRSVEGIYLLMLKSEQNLALSPGRYLLQITAKDDPAFFERLSGPIAVTLKESYFSFLIPKGQITNRPGGEGVPFRVELDTQAKNYPTFQGDPVVSFHLEKVDEKGNPQAVPVPPLTRAISGAKLTFAAHQDGLEPAYYVGHYAIKGQLATGEDVSLRSEDFAFVFRTWVWWYVIAAAAVALSVCFAVWLVFWKTDRFNPALDGVMTITSPENVKTRQVVLRGNRRARAMKWGRGGKYLEFGTGRDAMPELEKVAFRVEARREGKHKRLRVRVLNGLVTVAGQKVKTADIYHRDEIHFSDGGQDYRLRLDAANIKRTKEGKGR